RCRGVPLAAGLVPRVLGEEAGRPRNFARQNDEMMIATLVNTSSCRDANGGGQVETPFVQGPANDTSGQWEAGQPADVRQRADSSRRDDRQAHLPCQLCNRFEVWSLQH